MDGSSSEFSTFPRLLQQHAQTRPHHPAFREKNLGIWQTWTWSQVEDEVKHIACGLAARGFKRGMHLAIIGDNRPRLYWAMMAAQALGGIPVPLYQDAPASDMIYVLQDAEIHFAIAEDQEQVDKLLEMRTEYPAISNVIYDDEKGMRHYLQAHVLSLNSLAELGKAWFVQHPDYYQREVDLGQTNDVAVMLYTSGTTGKPKGVCQTHGAFLHAAQGGTSFDRLSADENIFSYLPMAWVGDHLFSFAQSLYAGFTVNCPESSDTVLNDLREIGPSYFFAPPRIFENLLTMVMIRMEDAHPIKQKIFHYFMDVARRYGSDKLTGAPLNFSAKFLYAVGELLIYGPLKNVLGLSRVRVAYTAGAAIGPDLFRFYRSIGINLKQLYGSTETCAYVCLQPDNRVRLDTVGEAAPGVEIKIAEKGEVCVRSPSNMQGYYKRPDATAEVIDQEGYFHTGDAGIIESDGQLKIIDRAADVGKLLDGSLFAPNYIENKLKFFPYIKEAVAFGDQREKVCAFINIDLEAVGHWAERNSITYSGYTDLACKPQVAELIQSCIEKVNHELAHEPAMGNTQIQRFLILHKELDPDDDELTRTRKVRRKFIAEKYAILIQALYSIQLRQFIETQVRFEDGRRGWISADLKLHNAKFFSQGETV